MVDLSCSASVFAVAGRPPDRRGQTAVPGQTGGARLSDDRVGPFLSAPTHNPRNFENLTQDDYLIDASDRTTLHRVRDDLCWSRRPKAVVVPFASLRAVHWPVSALMRSRTSVAGNR